MSEPSDVPSWVRRFAKQSYVCENCDDHIRPGQPFFYMIETQELFCCDCPPLDDMESICGDS